ncbi:MULTISPECIES: ATP-binding protein [Streptomyces]|mgnify:CR=1 FL=1|uniref:ATP-binding protein n=1 Tax=Streptomyces TaxID=1883 RepID=UPI000F65646F|nr:ATP-binding protein [Streptomyces alboflavus]
MPLQVQTPTPVHTFTQRISATPRGARLARRLARYHLDGWGIPYDSEMSDAVAQVAAELAANAATHGRVAGRDFELRLLLVPDGVRVEVTDTRTERRVPEHPELPGAEAESGRGLVLVAALAAEWGVAERAPGKTVWARLGHLSPSWGSPPAP